MLLLCHSDVKHILSCVVVMFLSSCVVSYVTGFSNYPLMIAASVCSNIYLHMAIDVY